MVYLYYTTLSNKRGALQFTRGERFFHGETVIETREFTEGISSAELEKQYKKLLRWRNITKRCVYHGLAKPQLFFKACEEVRAFEMRYNPNHDEHGRFTFGDGSATGGMVHYVPKGQKGNGQLMFVGAGSTMAQNDALYYSMYGTKAQSGLTGNEKSDKMEEDTASEADTEQTSLNESGTVETENSLTETYTYTSETGIKTSITECEDFDQLKQYMSRWYDIEVDDDMKNLDFETVRDSLVGLEDTAKDFPEIMDNLQVIDAKADAGAHMSTNGKTLSYNSESFQTKRSAEKAAKEPYTVSQSPKDIVVHEAGHMVEWSLCNGDVSEWNNNSVAIDLVTQAYNNITPNGPKLIDGLSSTTPENGDGMVNLLFEAKSISEYAFDGVMYKNDSNPSEILAEAFADCYRNGENAQPLSKEIRRLAQERYDNDRYLPF